MLLHSCLYFPLSRYPFHSSFFSLLIPVIHPLIFLVPFSFLPSLVVSFLHCSFSFLLPFLYCIPYPGPCRVCFLFICIIFHQLFITLTPNFLCPASYVSNLICLHIFFSVYSNEEALRSIKRDIPLFPPPQDRVQRTRRTADYQ